MNLFLPKDDKTTLSVATAILKNFNVKTPHTPCKYLKKIDVNKKNVVLIVVDGFGYNLYKKHYIKSYLHDYLVAKIYSTYPTTTSSSYVSLATGLSVKEHALTGWNICVKRDWNLCFRATL
jgi:predicted AlkP superfamily pyrophosphatase or phosphodiesterase